MIGHKTGGMRAAHSRTGVHTVLVDASLIPGTFRVDGTLWFALNVRVSNVVSDTGAGSSSSSLCALSVSATGRGIAWLHHFYWASSG